MVINLPAKIEAILFWKSEPMSIKRLSVALGESEEDIKKAIPELEQSLISRGVRIMQKDDELTITTAPAVSSIIEKLTKEELSRDIGRAGLETLSIILYYGPISRRDVDYVRGVNSTFIIRNLLVRGLVERVEDKKDQRVFLYKPTFDLLAHLGISKIEDLPDYNSVRSEFTSFIEMRENMDKGEGEEKIEPISIVESASTESLRGTTTDNQQLTTE